MQRQLPEERRQNSGETGCLSPYIGRAQAQHYNAAREGAPGVAKRWAITLRETRSLSVSVEPDYCRQLTGIDRGSVAVQRVEAYVDGGRSSNGAQ